MPQLINAQTNLPEDVGHDQLSQALTSGTHNLLKGQTLDVVDAQGQLVSLPTEQIPEAISSNAFRFPTSADIQEYQKEQKYGEGAVPTAKAAGAGLLRGATMGASDAALVRSGITTPEALSELKERHEIVSPISEVAGAIGAMALAPEAAGVKIAAEALQAARATGNAEKVVLAMKALDQAKEVAKTSYTAADLLNPVSAVNKLGNNVAAATAPVFSVNPETSSVVAKILAGAGPKAIGSGVEGAVWGGGMAVDEHVLGDADLNAENLLHNVGYGALFGGALGGTLGLGESAYKNLFNKNIEAMAIKDATIENASRAGKEAIPTSVPTSLEELAARNKALIGEGLETNMPSLNRAMEVNDILAGESNTPMHRYQMESFSDPNARLEYKMRLKSGSSEAKDLLDYEALQKAEGVNKLLPKFTQEIAPEAKLAENASDAGRKAVKMFEDQYNMEKKELAPVFKEIDSIKMNKIDTPDRLWQDIFTVLPDAREVVGLNPEKGQFFIKKFDATLGITKETHSELKNVVEALNKDKLTLGGLRNVRKLMGARVNFLTDPETSMQLSSIRKSMMDFIQDEVEKSIDNVKVRDTFRRYAVNEEKRNFIERDIFKGRFGDKVELGKGISHEDVLPQFFQNSDTVRAAREVLGVKKFDEISANYIKMLSDRATDPTKGFSSNKMASSLKMKEAELQEALSQHPETYKKINAIVDKMRVLPDSPPGNPSDTAAGLNILKKIQGVREFLKNPLSEISNRIGEKLESNKQRSLIDSILSGKAEVGHEDQIFKKQQMYGAFTKIERMQQMLSDNIDRGAKAIFKEGSKLPGPVSSALTPEEYDKKAKQIQEFTANPTHYLESLSKSTESLHEVAPDIAGSLNTSLTRATEYLASKLPNPGQASPLEKPYKVSPTEIAIFNRHFQIVQKPLSIYTSIKNGSLTHEQVETLQTVYPKIYEQMTASIMDQVTKKNAEVPYQKKLVLSMFLGQDLHNSMNPNNVATAQLTYNPPEQPKAQPHSSLSKLDQSNQLLTPLQQSEQRKNRA